MSATTEEVKEFQKFAEERLANGGASLSLELLLREFRAQSLSPKDTPEDPASEWTDEKNQRRADLVDKEIKGTITNTEQDELDRLQAEMLAYRRKVAPLPLDELRELHSELSKSRSMTKQTEDWFIEERIKALFGLHLTRRKDLSFSNESTNGGLRYLVLIEDRQKQSLRQFGVEVVGELHGGSLEELQPRVEKRLSGSQETRNYPYPVCLFYFTMEGDGRYYGWLSKPVVSAGKPRLEVPSEIHLRELDRQALDTIVEEVNRWYDAFFARVIVHES